MDKEERKRAYFEECMEWARKIWTEDEVVGNEEAIEAARNGLERYTGKSGKSDYPVFTEADFDHFTWPEPGLAILVLFFSVFGGIAISCFIEATTGKRLNDLFIESLLYLFCVVCYLLYIHKRILTNPIYGYEKAFKHAAVCKVVCDIVDAYEQEQKGIAEDYDEYTETVVTQPSDCDTQNAPPRQ